MLAALAVQTAAADLCLADTMPYGNFQAADCAFNNVIENSLTDPLPLFGSPAVSGNTLVFIPANFNSSVAGDNLDITDSQLVVDIAANAGRNIYTVSLSEEGAYALIGSGTTDTFASVSAPVWLKIMNVNGVGINPITVQSDMIFTSAGLWAGGATSGSWQGNLVFDVTAALRANGVPTGYATQVELDLDNVLTTESEVGTSAAIYKTRAEITVPEPATLSLLAAGMILAAARRKKN